jgi:hypothetical protein
MATAMGGVTGAVGITSKKGVAIKGVMDGFSLNIGNPIITTLNQCSCRRLCTLRHSNRQVSVCFFRLTFTDKTCL